METDSKPKINPFLAYIFEEFFSSIQTIVLYIFIAVSNIDIGNCLFVLLSKKDCDILGYSVR